jgi:hypothetical protein
MHNFGHETLSKDGLYGTRLGHILIDFVNTVINLRYKRVFFLSS